MNINWYPGHMAKANRLIAESMDKVDLVVELCDARIPQASRNPILADLVKQKPHILFMNKADLADPAVTEAWVKHYRAQDLTAIPGSAFEAKDRKLLIDEAVSQLSDIIEKAEARGLRDRRLRLMMIGIPNCGKSTLINALAKRKAAATEDRPGVTRGAQWIRTELGYDLLDMPGVLWPKLGTQHDQIALASTGAIKDQILDIVAVAYEAFKILIDRYPDKLMERYKLKDLDMDPYELFEATARKRGCVRSGGRIDENRFASLLLDEFRAGTIGRISLEHPDDPQPEVEEGNGQRGEGR